MLIKHFQFTVYNWYCTILMWILCVWVEIYANNTRRKMLNMHSRPIIVWKERLVLQGKTLRISTWTQIKEIVYHQICFPNGYSKSLSGSNGKNNGFFLNAASKNTFILLTNFYWFVSCITMHDISRLFQARQITAAISHSAG